jgi:A/G-specific adenine glycosylase
MWEVPHGERTATEDTGKAAKRIAKELTGLSVEPGREMVTIKHTVTRFAITLVCVAARRRGGRFERGFYQRARWIDPDQLARYPVSAPQRRLMNVLAAHRSD